MHIVLYTLEDVQWGCDDPSLQSFVHLQDFVGQLNE